MSNKCIDTQYIRFADLHNRIQLTKTDESVNVNNATMKIDLSIYLV